MTLSIAPIVPATLAQPTSLDVALQPGAVVTAQVMKLLDSNLVRIAIDHLTLDVAATIPLQAGQTLQLAVGRTATSLTLTPVTPDALQPIAPDQVATLRGNAVILDDIAVVPSASSPASKPVLTPPEVRAVAFAAQAAAAQQGGLSPLFANLSRAVTSGALPQPVLLAAAQLLSLRQPRDQPVTGADIKSALTTSGLLSDTARAASSMSPSTVPDMKAALIVLRQTLSMWFEPMRESLSAPSANATAPMLDALNNETPSARNPSSQPATPQRTPVPPPFRDALPSAQAVAMPSLAPDAEPVVVARQLLTDTESALARQTLLQIASLPDQTSAPRIDAMQPRWNFEIPFVTPQGTAMAQFEIARDDVSPNVGDVARVWRARFSIDIEPAGPVHALISFSGDTTSVKMWAERPDTVATLRAAVPQLDQSLGRAALKVGDIVIADGAPIRDRSPRAGHFVNRAS